MKSKSCLVLVISIFIFSTITPSICGNISKSNIFLKDKLENQILNNEPYEAWNRTFGGPELDWGWSVQQTSDSGYIICGETVSYSSGSFDAWLIKTDSYGNELWNKTYGGFAKNGGRSVDQTMDGGYIIGGYADSYGFPGHDFWLIKTDSCGNELWNKTYGGPLTDAGFSVCETFDGGYVITGYVTSFGSGGYDLWVIKTDSLGKELWNRTFGGLYEDYGMNIKQTCDDNFILTGFTSSFGFGNDDLWLLKIDTYGNELWNKTFGGFDNDWGSCVYETNDGGFIITGDTRSFSSGGYDLWLIKTDSFGNEEWNKIFGDSLSDDTGYYVLQTKDLGYIITGTKTSFQTGLTDIWLIKTDNNGEMQWNLTFGGELNDWSYSLDQTIDGDYIITGFTESYGCGDRDVFLIKVNSNNSGNHPPLDPIINGPTNGIVNVEYEYKVSTVDPEENEVFYFIDWGDNTNTSWIGSYSSGESQIFRHKWFSKGEYIIKVKSKDIFGAQSNWTSLEITMPIYQNIFRKCFVKELLINHLFKVNMLNFLLKF